MYAECKGRSAENDSKCRFLGGCRCLTGPLGYSPGSPGWASAIENVCHSLESGYGAQTVPSLHWTLPCSVTVTISCPLITAPPCCCVSVKALTLQKGRRHTVLETGSYVWAIPRTFSGRDQGPEKVNDSSKLLEQQFSTFLTSWHTIN